LKYSIDSHHVRPWAERTGKLILNFSGLELESHIWLLQMSGQPDRSAEFANLRFSKRVYQLQACVEARAFSPAWEASAREGWAQALELARRRNRIAHNPIAFAWTSEAEEGEPDYLGITEMKATRSDDDGGFLSKAAVEGAVNQIVALVTRMEALRKEWCVLRDAALEAS
jgi:hypothetical protein